MKKLMVLFSAISLVLVLGACNGEKIPISNASADLGFIYHDAKLLEEHSEYVIEAEYTGETVIAPFPESGDPDYKSYLSKVKVKQSFKGELQEGEEIWVAEAGAIVDGTYDTMAGYVHMNKEGEYVLFLSKFDMEIDGKTVYPTTGLHQGKFDLAVEEKAEHIEYVEDYDQIRETEYFGDLPEAFNELKEEVVEKYGDEVTK